MKKNLTKVLLVSVICSVLAGCTSTKKIQEEKKVESKKVEEKKEELVVGNVVHLTYHSEFCGMDRGVNILLPFEYDETKKYKVVYFLHGIFGNEYSMTGDKNMKVREITAKAESSGKDMIVVFPDMFARKDFNIKPGFDDAAVKCYDDFMYDLLGDLMPFIKSKFSILEGKENTAVCGFSMGGRESLFIGLMHPEMFGYVGAFAPAPGLVPGKDYNMPHPGQLQESELTFEGKESPFYLQVCCGNLDNVVGQFPKSYHRIFEKNGVEDNWFEVIGAGHDCSIVNPGYEKFLSQIFN